MAYGRQLSINGYTPATRIQPEWYVGQLAFKGGRNAVRPSSITGGGQMYGHEYQAFTSNVMKEYATGVDSFVGGGQMPGYPPSLLPLFGGRRGQGS